MSVSYGRYTITFDKEDGYWNADPKGTFVKVGHETLRYSFPQSRVFVEKTKQKIMQKMRGEGVGSIKCRKGEWIAHMNTDVNDT